MDNDRIPKACVKVVDEAIRGMSSLTFSKDPDFVQREIIEYESRMRVFGMEKFNGPCYISVINFYFSADDQKNHNACGVFILFVEEVNAGRFLKALGYRGFDEDDAASISKPMGEFCQTLGESLKKELVQMGYSDLILSAPSSFHNNVPQGVEFSYDEYSKYESNFYLWKEKIVSVEITIKPPR